MALIPRSRRGWIILGVLALTLVIGAWWVNRQLEPKQLTAIVLRQLGASLKLDFAFDGQPDYALRPEPRLLIPNLVVTDPVNGKAVLRAERLEIALPWATLTGGYPVITRLELLKPELDLPALQRWLATRPKTPFQLPTLTRGMQVQQGRVNADDWRLTDVELDLPTLKQGEAANADLALRYRQGDTAAGFAGTLHLDSAGLDSDFRLAGKGEVAHAPKPLAYSLTLAGHYLSNDVAFRLEAKSLQLQGDSPLPKLDAHGDLLFGDTLRLALQGELADWPQDWPALPTPLNEAKGPLPLQLSYHGKPDLSDPLTLRLDLADSKFNAALKLPEMLAWIDASNASPLPPLNGTLTAPQLNIEGIELKGVTIDISDDVPELPSVKP